MKKLGWNRDGHRVKSNAMDASISIRKVGSRVLIAAFFILLVLPALGCSSLQSTRDAFTDVWRKSSGDVVILCRYKKPGDDSTPYGHCVSLSPDQMPELPDVK